MRYLGIQAGLEYPWARTAHGYAEVIIDDVQFRLISHLGNPLLFRSQQALDEYIARNRYLSDRETAILGHINSRSRLAYAEERLARLDIQIESWSLRIAKLAGADENRFMAYVFERDVLISTRQAIIASLGQVITTETGESITTEAQIEINVGL